MPGTPVVSNSDKTVLGVWELSGQIGDRRGINNKLFLCGYCHEEFKKEKRMSSFCVSFYHGRWAGRKGNLSLMKEVSFGKKKKKSIIWDDPESVSYHIRPIQWQTLNPEYGWDSRSKCQLAGCVRNYGHIFNESGGAQ